MNPGKDQTILDAGGPGLITSLIAKSGKSSIIPLNVDEWRLRAGIVELPSSDRILADSCVLPFRTGSVDFLLADNLIEHIPRAMRGRFASECYRVCKTGMFLTTPNYWFPLEPHYFLPFFQFLPHVFRKKLSRRINVGWLRPGHYEPIDLLTTGELHRLFPDANIKVWKQQGLIACVKFARETDRM